MRKTLLIFLTALLLVLSAVFPAAATAEEAVTIPDFLVFTYKLVSLKSEESNSSYSVYAWEVPAEIGKAPAAEYLQLLIKQYDLQLLGSTEDREEGTECLGYSMPACKEQGFGTQIGEKTVKGCHVLWLWQSDLVHAGAGTVYLYLSRGIALEDTGARTALLSAPTPTPTPRSTPKPSAQTSGQTARPAPAVTPAPQSVCPECRGRGTRNCNTCDGKGYIEIRIRTPGYGGVGTGTRTTETKPCSNIFCHNGQVECWFCNGTGYVM